MLKTLLFWKEVKERGQTLVEVIIAMSVLAVLALGITGAANLTMRVSHDSERKNIALGVANEEMEFVRSIAYNDVGFSSPQNDDPSGILGYSEEVTRNNQTYNISRRVEYIDDPITALTEDYKKVMMLVSWLAPNNVTEQASLVTYISEDEICPDQFCPPGLRFDQVLCDCVEYTDNTEVNLPDCMGNGYSCLATAGACTGGGGTVRSNYECSTGICCEGGAQCTDQKIWNAITSTYDFYTCVPSASACAPGAIVSYYCGSGLCCQPPIACASASNTCMASESACTGVGGYVRPYTCVNPGEACCQLPIQCGGNPLLGQHCRLTASDCAANGEFVAMNWSCALQGGGLCCQPMNGCEASGFDCVVDASACASVFGTLKPYNFCSSGVCCEPPSLCEDSGYWDISSSGAGYVYNSCVAMESFCDGTVLTGLECSSGVCCQPRPRCTIHGGTCLGGGNACSAQDGTQTSAYSCDGTGQVCCLLPAEDEDPPEDPESGICPGPMVCGDECSTSADCQAGRPNTAGPCYFKQLAGGTTQCGREIYSWSCDNNQWSLHCADSYGQEGEACTNGCSWVPPASCTQKHCPADSSCGVNWGGRMDLCRQHTAFISGGCVDEVDPMTGIHECVDTSDGTCLGALCEP